MRIRAALLLLFSFRVCWAAVPSLGDFDSTYFNQSIPMSLVGQLTNWSKLATNSAGGTGGNWTASGTTNSTLAGSAFANNGVFTNGINVGGSGLTVFTNGATFQNITASRVVVTDSSQNVTNVATTAIIKGTGAAAVLADWTNTAGIFTTGTTKFLREDGSMQTVSGGSSTTTNKAFLFFPDSMLAPSSSAASASPVAASNTVYAIRFRVDSPLHLTNVVLRVSALNAAGHFGFSIYSIDGNTRVIDSGPLSTASAAYQSFLLASGGDVSPGVYWFAWTADHLSQNMEVVVPSAVLQSIVNASPLAFAITAGNASSGGQNPATLGTQTLANIPANLPLLLFQGN